MIFAIYDQAKGEVVQHVEADYMQVTTHASGLPMVVLWQKTEWWRLDQTVGSVVGHNFTVVAVQEHPDVTALRKIFSLKGDER